MRRFDSCYKALLSSNFSQKLYIFSLNDEELHPLLRETGALRESPSSVWRATFFTQPRLYHSSGYCNAF